MLSISPTDFAVATAAPVAADDMLFASPGWTTSFGGIDRVKAEIAADRMRRAGVAILENRGANVDDRFAGFKAGYSLVSEDKSEARLLKRQRKAEQRKQEFEGLTAEERAIRIREKAEKKAVAEKARYEDIYRRICADMMRTAQLGIPLGKLKDKSYTQEEANFCNRYETEPDRRKALAEAEPHCLLWRYAQSSEDRLKGSGYTWSGGYVAGKCWQD
jgi:hypothetical protein